MNYNVHLYCESQVLIDTLIHVQEFLGALHDTIGQGLYCCKESLFYVNQ